MRFSGKAAQFSEMNGPLLRLPAEWMAWAASSLPVPLSPYSSTVVVEGATCEICS